MNFSVLLFMVSVNGGILWKITLFGRCFFPLEIMWCLLDVLRYISLTFFSSSLVKAQHYAPCTVHSVSKCLASRRSSFTSSSILCVNRFACRVVLERNAISSVKFLSVSGTAECCLLCLCVILSPASLCECL